MLNRTLQLIGLLAASTVISAYSGGGGGSDDLIPVEVDLHLTSITTSAI